MKKEKAKSRKSKTRSVAAAEEAKRKANDAVTDEPHNDEAAAPDGSKNPETGAQKSRKSHKTLKRVLLGIIGVILICFIVLFGYAIDLYKSLGDVDLYSIYSHIETSTVICDNRGREIDRLYYTEDRELISADEIPENTKNAFVAIEDKTFYKHHGFNFRRMMGAVWSKLTGHADEISGTSTITQQLARNVYLSEIKSERTLKRKFSEMVFAYKIERSLTKDEILEAYLNTIYLGYGCYGIEAAAFTYFGKDVRDLNLAESAALAALPQAPDIYALIKDEEGEATKYLKKYKLYANDLSKERREMVLDLMAEQGYISEDQAAKAKVKLTKILKPHFEEQSKDFTYFTDFVAGQVAEDLVKKYSISEEAAARLVYTGGLKIYSTVDTDIQKIINEEFKDDYNFPWSEEEPQAAMVVTEVGTGAVCAMVGGRDAVGKKLFNRATSPRQPGSSIKPLAVYSAALQKSFDYAQKGERFPFVDNGYDRQGTSRWGDYITAGSTVIDERMTINGETWPLNFSRSFSGYRTFRTALQQSINTCAVKIQMQVGVDYSVEMLKKYGISTLADDASEPVNDLNSAALALGAMTYGVTPLDMALAYGAFPNKGIRDSAASYTEVLDASGKIILEREPEETKVMDEGVAFIMTDCLQSVVSRGIAGAAALNGIQAGGKTGTTNDNCDFWFVGFTPDYSAALWIGTDHNTVMNSYSSTAARLWGRIMNQIPEIEEAAYHEMPYDVVKVYGEYYTKGTEPGAYRGE